MSNLRLPVVGTPVREWLAAESASHVLAESDPSPSVGRHNVLVSSSDPRVARHVIRDWERIDAEDRHIGFLVLGPAGEGWRGAMAGDDGAIVRHALLGVLVGGGIGFLVGAVVVGLLAAIVIDGGAALVAAVLGGAVLGGPVGAVWAFTETSGWSSAYRESFVRPRPGCTYVATFHTADKLSQQFARLRVTHHTAEGVRVVDARDIAG